MQDGLLIISIFESLATMFDKMSPAFTGTSWDARLFQFYSILCLGLYYIYRIIKSRGISVIVLSKSQLLLSALLMSAIFFGTHQMLLILFHPSSYGLLGRIGFFFGSLFIAVVIPFHLGNTVNQWIHKIGGGPYIAQSITERIKK